MKFRKATKDDIAHIVKLLANDELGSTREQHQESIPKSYYKAFENIASDENQELIVVEDADASIIGTFQLSFIQYLTYQGGIRAQMEAVRVREDKRGNGVGKQIFNWATHRAADRGAHLLQLTTDKRRPEALKFYEKLGFKPSHEGMKLHF